MPLHQSLSVRSCSRSLPVLLLLTVAALTASAHSQDVLTYHNNVSRSGFNNKETILTQTNVNSATFGKLFILPADGHVDAEPLYISSVSISGVTHNLLIVVTEHDSVYAYDADTGANLWQITTLLPGETTSDSHSCSQISPEIGITSTPVITHPNKGTPVIYVVAMSKDASGTYHQRLHALNATSGAELFSGPVDIAAQYPGTGDNSSGGFVVFDPAQYAERSGLLLTGDTVYLAWTSHCDFRPYTGPNYGPRSHAQRQRRRHLGRRRWHVLR
jgi:outer membrane protein assembly factor BamB